MMFGEEYMASANGAKAKVVMLKTNPTGYFMLAMLAGAFIGIGCLLAFTVGGTLAGFPFSKVAMGIAFGVALSLVIIAGAELFTGNVMVLGNGLSRGTVTFPEALKLWVVCYLGNWLGAIVLSLLFIAAAGATGATGKALSGAAAAKTSMGPVVLFAKGILCNFLVCLAVWCGFRTKSDAAKLIMVFWCLFAFFTTGFEHSIANMTVLTIGYLVPMSKAITLDGYLYNLLFVTAGNILGALLFMTIPYGIAAKK